MFETRRHTKKSVRVNKMTGSERRKRKEKKVKTTFYPLHHRHILTYSDFFLLCYTSTQLRVEECIIISEISKMPQFFFIIFSFRPKKINVTRRKRRNEMKFTLRDMSRIDDCMILSHQLPKFIYSNRIKSSSCVYVTTKIFFTRLVYIEETRKLNKFFITFLRSFVLMFLSLKNLTKLGLDGVEEK